MSNPALGEIAVDLGLELCEFVGGKRTEWIPFRFGTLNYLYAKVKLTARWWE